MRLAVNRYKLARVMLSLVNRPIVARPMHSGNGHNNRWLRNAERKSLVPMPSNRPAMLPQLKASASEAPIAGRALRVPEIFPQGVAVAPLDEQAAEVVDDDGNIPHGGKRG